MLSEALTEDTLAIVCSGGCGKTTDDVSPREFWAGKVEPSDDPECLVPVWTCKECVAKSNAKMKNGKQEG